MSASGSPGAALEAPGRAALASNAVLAAALLAVDPAGLGGVALRARAGPLREAWMALLNELLPAQTPVRRIPLHANDAALLGGLDLGATLSAGKPVSQRGLLAQADGGLVLLSMAERVPASTAARLAAVLDTGEVMMARDGLAVQWPARIAVVALDEGVDDEERMAGSLLDRLAFHVALDAPPGTQEAPDFGNRDVLHARQLLPDIRHQPDLLNALCATAMLLGIDSLRAPLLALRAARAAAALAGLAEVDDSHARIAVQLVLAPRATRVPSVEKPESVDAAQEAQGADESPPPEAPPNSDDQSPPDDASAEPPSEEAPVSAEALEDMLVQAAQAAIAPGLLAALKAGEARRSPSSAAGRAGAVQKNQTRGRPIGARRGEPRGGARLHVLDTLRAAAPWQRIRQQMATERFIAEGSTVKAGPRIHVRREDFHVMRYRQNKATTTLFAVDASGSSALHRLAEAKGAVELLLAECYVRRDRVAVIAFRGTTAEVLLPPTRSLARAKRSLAALPGGGGTPLALGIDAACALAEQVSRQGETPVVVLLTDGRANIGRDGSPGRAKAAADALQAARQFRQHGTCALLIDTSTQPQEVARELASAMGATYVPLPFAGAQGVTQAVRLLSTGASR
ncbi:MAG: magnesium chelatase subunit D [Pseudomonadota bacterium]